MVEIEEGLWGLIKEYKKFLIKLSCENEDALQRLEELRQALCADEKSFSLFRHQQRLILLKNKKCWREINKKREKILVVAREEMNGNWVNVWEGGKFLSFKVKEVLEPSQSLPKNKFFLFILIGTRGRKIIRVPVGLNTDLEVHYQKGHSREIKRRRKLLIELRKIIAPEAQFYVETPDSRSKLFLS